MDETTYELVRYYQDLDVENEVIETGLSLEDAQEVCNNPETSSKTCTTPEALAITAQYGAWFVGFRAE